MELSEDKRHVYLSDDGASLAHLKVIGTSFNKTDPAHVLTPLQYQDWTGFVSSDTDNREGSK